MKVAMTVNNDRNLLMVQLFNKMVKQRYGIEAKVFYFQHNCNENNEVDIVGKDIEENIFNYWPVDKEGNWIKKFNMKEYKKDVYGFDAKKAGIIDWKAKNKWDVVVVTKTDVFHLDFLRFMCATTNTKLVAIDDETGWVEQDEEQYELRKEIVKNLGF